MRPEAAQSLELERIRHHRAQERHGKARCEIGRMQEVRSAVGDPGSDQRHRADGHRYRQAVPASERPADAGVQQDVRGPEAAGRECEHHAGHLGRSDAAQEGDAGRREQRPEDIHTRSRSRQSYTQRPNELERDRDPQVDAVKGLVEGEVHQRQCQPEQGGQPKLAGRVGPYSWPPDRAQHERCEQDAHQHGPARSEVDEQLGRERRPDLHRGDTHEHQPGRRDPVER